MMSASPHARALLRAADVALDLLKPGAEEAMAERHYGTRAPKIMEATLGSDAGWIGAARLTVDMPR